MRGETEGRMKREVLLALLLAIIMTAGCSRFRERDHGEASRTEELRIPVALAEAEVATMADRITVTGTIRAGDYINKVKFNDIDSALISSGGDINSVLSKTSIAESLIFAGFDIGADGLPGTGDESFNNAGADINKIKVNAVTGDFFNSNALAGVKPFDYNPTDSWTILAPAGETQQVAPLGAIGNSTVGQIFLNGDQNAGIYGLFAATEIGKVKFTEIAGAGAPDFELISTWL